jgi:hypothetical protein
MGVIVAVIDSSVIDADIADGGSGSRSIVATLDGVCGVDMDVSRA